MDNVKSLWITTYIKVQLTRKIVQKLLGRDIDAVNLFFGSVSASKKNFCSLLPIGFESEFGMNIANIKVDRLI